MSGGPDPRRLMRINRLLSELGHADVCDALEELKTARNEIQSLKLGEEGAQEAFGVVVQAKRDLEAEVVRLKGLLASAHESIRQANLRIPKG